MLCSNTGQSLKVLLMSCTLSFFFRQEMLRRYPDAEATMGEARLVGETGPDDAGNRLTPTTVKVRMR